MKNRQNLANWLINIHNIVNKELGKNVIEPDDALLLIFNNFNNKHTHNEQITENFKNEETEMYSLCILILIFVILIIIAVVYKKN